MLINLTNHPLDTWSDLMLQEAKCQFHSLQEMEFPDIDPHASEEQIQTLAKKYAESIKIRLNNSANENNAILIMGEFSFCYSLINILKENGFKCILATSNRKTIQINNNEKLSKFIFVKFREYC